MWPSWSPWTYRTITIVAPCLTPFVKAGSFGAACYEDIECEVSPCCTSCKRPFFCSQSKLIIVISYWDMWMLVTKEVFVGQQLSVKHLHASRPVSVNRCNSTVAICESSKLQACLQRGYQVLNEKKQRLDLSLLQCYGWKLVYHWITIYYIMLLSQPSPIWPS